MSEADACCPPTTTRPLPWSFAAAIDLYRAMDMTFWLPQAEAVLAQSGA